MKKRRIWIVLLVLLAGSVLLAQDALTIYTSGNVGIRTDPQQDPGVPLKVQGKIQDRSGEVMPVGSILAFGGNTPPAGWFLCNGDSKSISEFPDLYAVISTHFGPGDNPPNTFSLPNFQGISPTGVGSQDFGEAPNLRTKTGPGLGTVREDVFQDHWHDLYTNVIDRSWNSYGNAHRTWVTNPPYANATLAASDAVRNAITFGSQPVRAEAYTHGPEIGVNFIIKY